MASRRELWRVIKSGVPITLCGLCWEASWRRRRGAVTACSHGEGSTALGGAAAGGAAAVDAALMVVMAVEEAARVLWDCGVEVTRRPIDAGGARRTLKIWRRLGLQFGF